MARRRPITEDFDDVPLSALLRSAQDVYANAAERALSLAGYDDLPRAGSFIVSAMNWSNASLEAVIRWMGVSKQAVSQSVDSLVVRGYLERAHDAHDRRKVNLVLTERGRGAGDAAKSAVEGVDTQLRSRVGPQRIAQTRETLAALTVMGRGVGPKAPTPPKTADDPGNRQPP
jgi:DNA-binding MarR family transcriptional regulator